MNYNGKVLDVIEEVKKVVVGKDICVAKIMASIIAGGNILMDDVPGVERRPWLWHLQMQWGLRTRECSLHRTYYRGT